ncbi:uncharacterized protein LOC121385046 [Gigantopelta aegis]|uniref:uncharacterized protein LOC121385046 n=1 Tax=Gigantopelta aegis TaxID=1735272 RepID=UPI001B88E192|nr:uncharacterized protein LOC121385046 [Gigantopelta aegis]
MNYTIFWFIGLALVTAVSVTSAVFPIDPARILTGNCSKSYEFCDRQAQCIELSNVTVYCRCPNDTDTGDGLKNGTGCLIVEHTCIPANVKRDCHPDAECIDLRCKCKKGYEGNGQFCNDINECLNKSICSPYAICRDEKGSYSCKCDIGFVGDGVTCKHHCTTNVDCPANAECNPDEECVCKDGYSGDPAAGCQDVDECVEKQDNCDDNAICTNTPGSFECKCNNGFAGDGVSCRALPKTCDEILKAKRSSRSGSYEIDTDGTGPADSLEVKCIMKNGIGITVIWPKSNNILNSPIDGTKTVKYDATLDQIKPLVNNSAFCYQDVWFKCPSNFNLLQKVSWTDAEGKSQRSWGSVVDDSCACGVLGKCQGGGKCNCNGQNSAMRQDFGKLTSDNFKLPVESLKFTASKTSAVYMIGAVKCGPKPFDLPKNCDEAKRKMGVRKNQPLLIDADGPDKPLAPFLIYCDVKSYWRFGISVVPNNLPPGSTLTSSEVPLKYPAQPDQISALVQGSVFCSQSVEYECKNAPAGPVTGGASSSSLGYFPGGAADIPNSCACGLTGTCDDPAKNCNCQITDGQKRKDIGLVIDKDALPLVSISVTVGGDSYAKLTVGELKCGQQQFEIEPNCEKLRGVGYDYDYTYMIDPDGIGGEPPFPAQCIMMKSPPRGATVINHGNGMLNNLTFAFLYKRVTKKQVAALKERSTYCTQAVSLKCNKFALHPQSGNNGFWLTQEGTKKYYFTGDGSKTNCNNKDNMCECDKAAAANGFGTDTGDLTNIDDVPVASVDFRPANNAGGSISYSFGPLMCYETFPTCADMYLSSRRNSKKGEKVVSAGQYTIDPDQFGGEEPFQVYCSGIMTRVPVISEPEIKQLNTGESQCYNVTYKGGDGNVLTRKQIEALVKASASCNQYLLYTCINAPVTGNVYYSKCSGGDVTKVPGWAGSAGYDKCQCGVTGVCKGGTSYACNCDLEDSKLNYDKSFIVNKELLPVCQVCVKVPELPTDPNSPVKARAAKYSIGDIMCSNVKRMGTRNSCQHYSLLSNTGESGNVLIRANKPGEKAFPVYCDITVYPEMGVLVVKPKTPTVPIPKYEYFNYTISYMVYNRKQIEQLIDKAVYCEQEISLMCNDSGVTLSNVFGWYGRDGKVMPYWSKGSTPCDGDGSNCKCNAPGENEDFGLITDKGAIPVSRVELGPAKGDRKLTIGDVRCYDIYKDCYDIMQHGAKRRSSYYRNSTYVVDPDGAGGVSPFLVKCEFHSKDGYAVTEIIYKGNPVTVIKNSGKPLQFKVPITYPASSPKQSNTLAKQAGFCYQGMLYECIQSPLVNNNNPQQSGVQLFGTNTTTFGKGADTDGIGCPCSVVGTCNLNGNGNDANTCRCDNKGSMMTFDNGTVIDKDQLPLVSGSFGGQDSPNSVGKFTIGPMRCANKPFDIPRDCEEALKWGYKSGEYLIFPKDYVDKPFFVFCDMNINPGHGVIKVLPKVDEPIPVTGDPINVTYHGPTPKQLEAIVKVSKFCYQPVKYDCIGTKFFGDGAVTWSGPTGSSNTNFGSASPFSMECTCGSDNYCGGYDGKTKMRRRKCNCDIGDADKRADAGIISSKALLPITKMNFNGWIENAIANAAANLTVGNLYCGTEEFDINECELDFHDCHKWADCRNTDGGYECICRKGFRGKISGISTEQVWANGRQCFDDDECSYNKCPSSAICTNLLGTYNCTCKEGYNQVGFDVCKDINECLDPELNDCDVNARCDNFEGGYSCACKRGFKDNGNATKGDCEPQGLCACYGDPHCISFDKKFLDFQGQCTYVMAQDGCQGELRTFQVLINTWNQDRPGITSVSWVKAVIIKMKGLEFEIRQSKEILLNSALINGYDKNGILIIDDGLRLKVYTDFGLQVTWDGSSEIEVTVPKNYQSMTCGLCGNFNFNASDDWTIGPECPLPGTLTTIQNVFGHSWVVPESLNDPNNKMCYKKCDEPDTKRECKMDVVQAYTICDAIFDTDRSPFANCLMKMDQALVAKMREDCKFDLCEVPDDISIGQCSSANRLVTECAKIGEQVPEWRNKPGIYCEKKCGENMRYAICGGLNTTDPGPILTCQHVVKNEMPNPLDACIESCFCDEGFVLDVDKCIPKDQCGCSEGGTYMSVGQVVIAEDCSYKRECLSDGHTLSNTSLTCHENATCSTDMDTGVHGCHCKKGFMGDGVTECREDPCADVKCKDSKTMECVDGECRCIMGYTGDCQRCFDIDECATDTHNCNHVGQECQNTKGGFTCKCLKGFLPVGAYCADIDECDQNKKTPNFCAVNSECRNKPGGYDCVCCGGYKKGPDGCILDGSGDHQIGDQAKCCSCYGKACNQTGPVCGTDGKTYPSLKSLIVQRCKEGNKLVGLSNEGPCPATCAELDCESQNKYMKCKTSPETGKATCQCPKCSDEELETEKKTVCASTKVKFESICAFKAFSCQTKNTEITIIENATDCGPGSGAGEPVGKFGSWSECDKCGVGQQSREGEYINIKDKDGNPYKIIERRICYKTCEDSPCKEGVCPPGKVCVFDKDNVTSCICPECKGWGSEPICTLRGQVKMTYDNDCERMRDACLLNETINTVQNVACGRKPLNCTKMFNWVSKREADGCYSQYHDFGKCEGGCGQDPEDCCQEIKVEEDVEYFCGAERGIMRKKNVVVDCKCISFEELLKQKQGVTTPSPTEP